MSDVSVEQPDIFLLTVDALDAEVPVLDRVPKRWRST